jgi:HEPN domain-containing protein
MKVETQEWVDSAEADWEGVNQLITSEKNKVLKLICFHAQQCAEMYLKARLTEAVVYFPKTHNLGDLLDLVLPVEPEWEAMREMLDALTVHAVITRYPGYKLTTEEAEEAAKICAEIRTVIRPALGLDDEPPKTHVSGV